MTWTDGLAVRIRCFHLRFRAIAAAPSLVNRLPMPSSDPEGAKPAAPPARTVAVSKTPLSLLPLPCSFLETRPLRTVPRSFSTAELQDTVAPAAASTRRSGRSMATIFEQAARLVPRHDTSSFTPAEMAEMLIDPYEKAPKCTRIPDLQT
jgi:hypothetical protein